MERGRRLAIPSFSISALLGEREWLVEVMIVDIASSSFPVWLASQEKRKLLKGSLFCFIHFSKTSCILIGRSFLDRDNIGGVSWAFV